MSGSARRPRQWSWAPVAAVQQQPDVEQLPVGVDPEFPGWLAAAA